MRICFTLGKRIDTFRRVKAKERYSRVYPEKGMYRVKKKTCLSLSTLSIIDVLRGARRGREARPRSRYGAQVVNTGMRGKVRASSARGHGAIFAVSCNFHAVANGCVWPAPSVGKARFARIYATSRAVRCDYGLVKTSFNLASRNARVDSRAKQNSSTYFFSSLFSSLRERRKN